MVTPTSAPNGLPHFPSSHAWRQRVKPEKQPLKIKEITSSLSLYEKALFVSDLGERSLPKILERKCKEKGAQNQKVNIVLIQTSIQPLQKKEPALAAPNSDFPPCNQNAGQIPYKKNSLGPLKILPKTLALLRN